MDKKLNQIVQLMSRISVSQKILDQVNIEDLLKELSDDYKKLDTLKEVRANHESMNIVSQFLNKSELNKAQLDASELQVRFSKKLSQLLILSIIQSRQLYQQQTDLSNQQRIIKKQTEQLAENDKQLNDQQNNLIEQNKKLEKLIIYYSELKGLTQDGALKLINIANEVKETRDSLIIDFEKKIHNIEDIRKKILIEQSKSVSQQIQQLNNFINDIEQHLITYRQQFDQQITQIHEQHQLEINKIQKIIPMEFLKYQKQYCFHYWKIMTLIFGALIILTFVLGYFVHNIY